MGDVCSWANKSQKVNMSRKEISFLHVFDEPITIMPSQHFIFGIYAIMARSQLIPRLIRREEHDKQRQAQA